MTGKLGCTGFLKFAWLNSSSSKKRALKITNLTRVSLVEGLEYRCNINATEWTKHLKRPGPWLKGNMTWSIAYINIKPTLYFFYWHICFISCSFLIDSLSGSITVKSKLDRETYAQYSLTVEAADSGVPSLSSSVVVTVMIGDVNDNPPMFSQQMFYGSIREDASTGSTVVKVRTVTHVAGVVIQPIIC